MWRQRALFMGRCEAAIRLSELRAIIRAIMGRALRSSFSAALFDLAAFVKGANITGSPRNGGINRDDSFNDSQD